MVRCALVLAIAMLSISVADADPLANARKGKVECDRPETAKKTCGALTAYIFNSDGTIIAKGEVLLARSPALSMRTSSVVAIKGDSVCGVLRKEDIATATILAGGIELAEDKALSLRAKIAQLMSSDIDQEICTSYITEGDHTKTQNTVGGQIKPQYSNPVIWVNPDEGYVVAP